MSLNGTTSPSAPPHRQIPVALFAAAVVLVAAVSIGATAAYFELHPGGPSVGGSNVPEVVGTVPVGSSPEAIALDAANNTVFVANAGSNNVSAVSATTDRLVATIPVGGHPDALAFDSNDSEVFVANYASDSVTVFNAVNFSFVATIAVGVHPDGAVYDPSTGDVSVANDGSNNVSVISNLSNTVVATVPVGVGPAGLAYDFSEGQVFVANSGSNNLSVIPELSNHTVAAITVGLDPVGVTYDAATAQVFATNAGSGSVSVISDASDRVVESIPLGNGPAGATADPAKGEVFVANSGSNNVSVVSESQDRVVFTLGVGGEPAGLAYAAAQDEVFVTNNASDTVSVISDTSNVAIVDDLGRPVTVPLDPQRIVVLAPSIMDIVYRLGLRSAVVGIGCDGTALGGIYNEYSPNQTALWSLSNASCVTDFPELNTGDIALLGPQLVLASTLTSALAVQQLTEVYGLPVVVFAPSSLWGIVADVRTIAEIFPESLSAATQLESSLDEVLANATALDTKLATDHVALPSVLLTYYFDPGAYLHLRARQLRRFAHRARGRDQHRGGRSPRVCGPERDRRAPGPAAGDPVRDEQRQLPGLERDPLGLADRAILVPAHGPEDGPRHHGGERSDPLDDLHAPAADARTSPDPGTLSLRRRGHAPRRADHRGRPREPRPGSVSGHGRRISRRRVDRPGRPFDDRRPGMAAVAGHPHDPAPRDQRGPPGRHALRQHLVHGMPHLDRDRLGRPVPGPPPRGGRRGRAGDLGAGLQGVFRNPLADPYLLGLSAGAALGASSVYTFDLAPAGRAFILPIFAFFGGLVPGTVIYFAARSGRNSPQTLLLTGVALNAIAAAVLATFLLYNPVSNLSVNFWLLGGLEYGTWSNDGLVIPVVLVAGLLLVLRAQEVNLLQLGPDVAQSLGSDPRRLTRQVVLVTTVVTAAAVAFAGIIGFVGLVAPHVVRRLVGVDYRRVIPLSALVGAGFLVIAWDIAQVVIRSVVIPVGIPTAFFGAIFFLYLLYRRSTRSRGVGAM